MHPILLRIPLPGGRHFDIATYGAMMALGTLAAVFASWRLGKREGVRANAIIDMGFWGVICGVLGAKLWYIVQYWPHYADKSELLLNFRSGLVWYGGVLGGVAGMVGYLQAKRLPLLKFLDIAAPAGILGLVFGRLGCFFNGCCYGELTDSWLGACFAKVTDGEQVIGSPAFMDQLSKGLVAVADAAARPVYPTQLFESLGSVVIFLALVAIRRWRRFYGEQLAFLFLAYPVLRFTIEFYRGDHARSLWGLTAAQVFSIASFGVAALGFLYLRLKRPSRLAVGPIGRTKTGGGG